MMRDKVDSYHASDTVAIKSITGFLVWLNFSLIHWFSNKHTSVERNSFGYEFVAMTQCFDYLIGRRYNLRMMIIPCGVPSYIEGSNQYVLANTILTGSALKRKNQIIACHFLREGSSCDKWRTTYVNTHKDVADLLTKKLSLGDKRKVFV